MAHIKPKEAPIYDVPHIPIKEKVLATVQYLLPLGFIIFMVIGLIFPSALPHLQKLLQQVH